MDRGALNHPAELWRRLFIADVGPGAAGLPIFQKAELFRNRGEARIGQRSAHARIPEQRRIAAISDRNSARDLESLIVRAKIGEQPRDYLVLLAFRQCQKGLDLAARKQMCSSCVLELL